MKPLKQQLYEGCLAYAESRIGSLTDSIKATQQSANEETKSSAGDKYETARSMAQLEIQQYQVQLAEAKKLKQELARISTEENTQTIKAGSLVFTSRGNFYIAINAGPLQADGHNFLTVSMASPIVQKLIKLKVGDSFLLNHQEFSILKIQ